MAKYTAEELRAMLAKGQAMKNAAGDPSYPIADAEDLGNAVHAVGLGGKANDVIRRYIIGRAKALNMEDKIPDTWQEDGSLSSPGRSAAPQSFYTRSEEWPLIDLAIRAGGDGRTVDAYAAAFNVEYPVSDQDGEYNEVIDQAAFNRAIEHARRANGGWKTPVMFNHGMTIFHTPSERHSVPIGVPEEIRAEPRGLYTRTRYHKTETADEVLEAIREGSISAYSFSGSFRRSDPAVPRGGFRADRSTGNRPTVRRTESTLREFGPATFAANAGASIVGVRAEQVLGSLAPGEIERLATMLRTGTPLGDPPDDGTPPNEGLAADDPPLRHSTRSPKQELQARRAQFLIRHGGDQNA